MRLLGEKRAGVDMHVQGQLMGRSLMPGIQQSKRHSARSMTQRSRAAAAAATAEGGAHPLR